MNDPATVIREYAREERFLARRLAAQAELLGPRVEDAAVEAMVGIAPRTVLEVGCGTGDFTERVQRELGVGVAAVDLSPRMVELTRGRGLATAVADIQSLPFPGAGFDCVLANRVLYHLPDIDRGLAEISRVLRPGGVLVAIVYSDRHLGELYDLVGRSQEASPFSAENGDALLGRNFGRVERHDLVGTARFAGPDAVIALLGAQESFGGYAGADVELLLRSTAFPFDSTYRHALFLARRG